jgi:WD40 repeat protein
MAHNSTSFWEALSGICSRSIQHPDSQVNRLCISPDKKLLAAAGSLGVKLYDIKSTNPNPILTFEGHTGNVTGVAFHCEGKWMVTSSEDGTVKIWDTRTGTIQRNYNHEKPVNDVVIHPNQGELISCDRGGNVRVWDLGENKCTHQLIPEDEVSVASVTVASDGSMLCAGNNSVWILGMRLDRTLTAVGQCLRVENDTEPGRHISCPSHQVPGPSPIHQSNPSFPRRPSSCDVLSGSHCSNLVSRFQRYSQSTQRDDSQCRATTTSCNTPQCISIGDHSPWPSTLGMGLCL